MERSKIAEAQSFEMKSGKIGELVLAVGWKRCKLLNRFYRHIAKSCVTVSTRETRENSILRRMARSPL